MIEQQEEEIIEQYVVPINSDYDLNVAGYTFETKRVIEGIILGGAMAFIAFIIFSILPLRWTIKIAFIVMFAIIGIALALKGVNGDSITDYFLNTIIFKSKKRIAKYNRRPKTSEKDKKYFINEIDEEETMIPREKLEAMWHKYVTKKDVQGAKNNFEDLESENDIIFFEEDIDVLGKPTALMSPLEKRKKEKALKKAEKERKKRAAKIRKMNKKRDRMYEEFK